MKSSSRGEHPRAGLQRRRDDPANGDTCGPIATSASATPHSRAQLARERPTDPSQPSNPVRPWRHSSWAACSASHAGRGGSP